MNPIITKHGEVTALARLFSVSPRTVYASLNCESDSDLALRIRKAALERGGKEVD